jgi:mRNA-degrading endonuclease RelE of RelBE toxin-antitoxin system
MILIETPVFTKEIGRLLPDDLYREFQAALVKRPDAGDLITGSGGLRKIRWSVPGRGKRGGMRVIYYWWVPDTIFLLYPFKKNEVEDLTKDQVKELSKLVKEWLK